MGSLALGVTEGGSYFGKFPCGLTTGLSPAHPLPPERQSLPASGSRSVNTTDWTPSTVTSVLSKLDWGQAVCQTWGDMITKATKAFWAQCYCSS